VRLPFLRGNMFAESLGIQNTTDEGCGVRVSIDSWFLTMMHPGASTSRADKSADPETGAAEAESVKHAAATVAWRASIASL